MISVSPAAMMNAWPMFSMFSDTCTRTAARS